MHIRFRPAWLTLFAVLCLAPGGHAWEYDGINVWPDGTARIAVGLGSGKLYSDGKTGNQVGIEAIEAWNPYMQRLQLRTSTGPSSGGEDNGTNEMFFARNVYGEAFGPNTLAITLTTYTTSNRRLEADIVVNSNLTWDSFRGPLGFRNDLKRVLIHEVGHFLGLKHPDEAGQNVIAIMNRYATDIETLTDDDKDGVGYLYGYGVLFQATPPAIIQQPVDQSIRYGEYASFGVTATGANLRFQWKKDGGELTGQNGSTLSIYGATPSDSGSYTVAVSNTHGSVESRPAELTVAAAPPPYFSQQPEDKLLDERSALSIYATASGIREVSYQWFLNGQPIQGQTSSIYSIPRATGSDEGEYYCEARIGDTVTRSRVATVRLRPFVNTPVNRLAWLGSTQVNQINSLVLQPETSFVLLHGGKMIWNGPSFTLPPDPVPEDGEYLQITQNIYGESTPLPVRRYSQFLTLTAEQALWDDAFLHNQTLYFAMRSRGVVERYNLSTRQWMQALPAPEVTALHVDDSGVYMAAGDKVLHWKDEGTAPATVISAADISIRAIGRLHNRLVLVGLQPGLAKGSVKVTAENSFDIVRSRLFDEYFTGWAETQAERNRIVLEASFGGSYALLTLEIDAATGAASSLLPAGNTTARLGSELPIKGLHSDLVFDGTGWGIDTGTLTYFRRYGWYGRGHSRSPDGLVYQLQSSRIQVYSSNGQQVGSIPLQERYAKLIVDGDDLVVFGPAPAGKPPATQRLPRLVFTPAPPRGPFVENSNVVHADRSYLGTSGTVYLTSFRQGRVRRWDIQSRSFVLPPIDLRDMPAEIGVSESSDIIWVLYPNGELAWLDGSLPNPVENVVKVFSEPVSGFSVVGRNACLEIFAAPSRFVTIRPDSSESAFSLGGGPRFELGWGAVDETGAGTGFFKGINGDGIVIPVASGIPNWQNAKLIARGGVAISASPDGRLVALNNGAVMQSSNEATWSESAFPAAAAAWSADSVFLFHPRAGAQSEITKRNSLTQGPVQAQKKLNGRPLGLHFREGRLFAVVWIYGEIRIIELDEALNLVRSHTFPGRLINISTLSRMGGDASPLTSGFFLSGETPKTVLVRSIGPGLIPFGVSGTANDPQLTLYNGRSEVVARNDDWSQGAGVDTLKDVMRDAGGFALPNGSKDAVLVATLTPGSTYTVVASNRTGAPGMAINEVYDVSRDQTSPRFINISTRGDVGPGNKLVAGFVILGDSPRTVIVRAIGPSLAAFGVGGFLANPRLKLYAQDGKVIAANDDWRSFSGPSIAAQIADQFPRVGAFKLEEGTKDSVWMVTLQPGQYTAEVESVDGSTGNAMVEVYELSAP